MSSDSAGGTGNDGDTNSGTADQNLANALAANEAITGDTNQAVLGGLAASGANVSGSPGYNGGQDAYAAAQGQIPGVGQAYANINGNPFAGPQTAMQSLSGAVSKLSQADMDLTDQLMAGSYNMKVGDRDSQASPGAIDNIAEYQDAVDKSNDAGSWLAEQIGITSPVEYDLKDGYREGTDFSLGKTATGLPATILGAAFGVPTVASLGVKASNAIADSNQYEYRSSDPSRGFSMESLFGGDASYSPNDFQGVFGGEGNDDLSQPPRQAQYFPTPNITPPIQQTASNAVPSPFDYYGGQYIKQQQQWDGNNFTPAPFVRRVV